MALLFDRQSMGNIKTLVAPITTDNPVGANLYYEPIYDQIKEARREDDPTLSQGVWQIALKKADWAAVENLSCQALINQTKDLQIASWLAEAWVAMDQLDGMQKGINLIQQLSEAYWVHIYPEIEQDSERRIHLFEWIDITLTNRLVMAPILENPFNASHVCLADWMQATRLDTVSKRSPNRQKMLRQAEQQQEFTLEKIHQIVTACSKELLTKLIDDINHVNKAYEILKKSLDSLFIDNIRPPMNELPDALIKFKRFLQTGIDLEQPSIIEEAEMKTDSQFENTPNTSFTSVEPTPQVILTTDLSAPIQTRADAYKMIGRIGDFLQTTEPHSPAPALLKRIATWENKNISDIFKDFGDKPEDWTALAKFIGSGSSIIPK
jgi:type VI secretion system ImpA family protein